MASLPHVHPHSPSTVPVGFWARALALAVDYVLQVVAVMILLAALGADPAMAWGDVPVDSRLSAFVVHILPALATLVFWMTMQATPGKSLISARIVDARTGGAAGTGQLVVRYLGYIVSALPLGLGFFWAVFDRRKQTWHDKLARTVVVRTRTVQAPAPARRVPVPAVAWPRCAVGAGPWMNPGAGQGEPSLLWLTHDTLHVASVGRADLPGFAAAAAAGHGIPSRAVPLWCLHSVEGPEDSGELAVTYSVQGGGVETTEAKLGDAKQREQLLSALLHHLGSGWDRVAERENRWALAGNLLLLMVLIAGGMLFLQWGAAEIAAGRTPEVQGTDRTQLVLQLALLAAAAVGPATVGVIGKVALGLTGLLIPFALFSPPGRIAIRRTAAAGAPQPEGAAYAYPV
jgi:uncharacterized RDD family membrane protein YckC